MTAARQLSILALCAALAGCGGGSPPAPPPIPVQGRIAPLPPTTRAVVTTGSLQVVALPLPYGMVGPSSFRRAVTAAVAADGTFTVGVTAGEPWLLLLVHPAAATPAARFVAFVAVASDGVDDLLLLDPDAAGLASYNLGTLTVTGDVARAATPLSPSLFGVSAAALPLAARLDARYRVARNQYLNTTAAGWWGTSPYVNWMAPAGTFLGLLSGWFDPVQFTAASQSFQLVTDAQLPPIWAFSTGGCFPPGYTPQPVVPVELVPPAPYTWSGLTLGPGSPITNASAVCYPSGPVSVRVANGSNFALDYASPPGGPSYYTFLVDMAAGRPPPGDWHLRIQGTETATFDPLLWWPLDQAGIHRALVPSPSVVQDALGRVTRIAIRWYAADASGALTLVTDPAVVWRQARTTRVSLYAANVPGLPLAQERMTPAAGGESVATPNQAWTVVPVPGAPGMQILYQLTVTAGPIGAENFTFVR